MYGGGITGFYRHVKASCTTNLILNFVLYSMIQFRDGSHKIPVDEIISDFCSWLFIILDFSLILDFPVR